MTTLSDTYPTTVMREGDGTYFTALVIAVTETHITVRGSILGNSSEGILGWGKEETFALSSVSFLEGTSNFEAPQEVTQ